MYNTKVQEQPVQDLYRQSIQMKAELQPYHSLHLQLVLSFVEIDYSQLSASLDDPQHNPLKLQHDPTETFCLNFNH